ncbi:MAG: alpha/beta hydrolase [Anaerolineae bacterium]|nr:alpha/beta hydrolase [Anaerolineae bacterium]
MVKPCDFGGRGPVIHLAHANGFPPGAYRLLAAALTDQYHVVALPARPLWPGSQPESAPAWRPLADDLIAGLDALGLRGIVGVGHSIGGVLTMWAAVRRPDLFRAVVLIDPVILPPTLLFVLRWMRRLGLGKRQPLVRGALRRRRTWPSRQACFDQYRAKPVFARWSDESLWAYVEAATEQSEAGVALAYPPEWEAHIFATTPLDAWRDVPRLRPPLLVIRGAETNTFRAASQARMARLVPQARFVVIQNAGHLVPLERPAATGAAIRNFLASTSNGQADGREAPPDRSPPPRARGARPRAPQARSGDCTEL